MLTTNGQNTFIIYYVRFELLRTGARACVYTHLYIYTCVRVTQGPGQPARSTCRVVVVVARGCFERRFVVSPTRPAPPLLGRTRRTLPYSVPGSTSRTFVTVPIVGSVRRNSQRDGSVRARAAEQPTGRFREQGLLRPLPPNQPKTFEIRAFHRKTIAEIVGSECPLIVRLTADNLRPWCTLVA